MTAATRELVVPRSMPTACPRGFRGSWIWRSPPAIASGLLLVAALGRLEEPVVVAEPGQRLGRLLAGGGIRGAALEAPERGACRRERRGRLDPDSIGQRGDLVVVAGRPRRIELL